MGAAGVQAAGAQSAEAQAAGTRAAEAQAAGVQAAGVRAMGTRSAAEKPASIAELERQGQRFELLATAFGQKPSEALLVALVQPEAAQAFEDGGASGPKATGPGGSSTLACALAKLAGTWRCDPAATLEALRDEYAVLLEQPGAMAARPWGSCYIENDGALFGAETLAVRKAYTARGFLPAGYPHEADDHLAFELAFLAELTYAACDALDAGDESACSQALTERSAFASDHLRPWVGRFAHELGVSSPAKGAQLYPPAAAEAVALVSEVIGSQ